MKLLKSSTLLLSALLCLIFKTNVKAQEDFEFDDEYGATNTFDVYANQLLNPVESRPSLAPLAAPMVAPNGEAQLTNHSPKSKLGESNPGSLQPPVDSDSNGEEMMDYNDFDSADSYSDSSLDGSLNSYDDEGLSSSDQIDQSDQDEFESDQNEFDQNEFQENPQDDLASEFSEYADY
jgi:hypothetical protein